jgi:folylpolyglutamate synthase/dihydropteroate synthase
LLAEEIAKTDSNYRVVPMVTDAYKAAVEICDSDGLILVTGSHYTVGEVLGEMSR